MADTMRAGTAPADKPGLFAPLFTDIRVAAVLGLGFAQGMPFLLVYATQSAWLSEAKVPLATIGLMSELTIAYKFKFLWAPFLDRYDPPLLGRLLGRRRGWIVAAQIAVAAALAGVAFGDPPTGSPGRWPSPWRSASRGRRRTSWSMAGASPWPRWSGRR